MTKKLCDKCMQIIDIIDVLWHNNDTRILPLIRKGGEKEMATIKVGENETLDSAMRRFKRRCARDGIIGDLRKKEQYEKPSVRRKKKAEAARKRSKM